MPRLVYSIQSLPKLRTPAGSSSTQQYLYLCYNTVYVYIYFMNWCRKWTSLWGRENPTLLLHSHSHTRPFSPSFPPPPFPSSDCLFSLFCIPRFLSFLECCEALLVISRHKTPAACWLIWIVWVATSLVTSRCWVSGLWRRQKWVLESGWKDGVWGMIPDYNVSNNCSS